MASETFAPNDYLIDSFQALSGFLERSYWEKGGLPG